MPAQTYVIIFDHVKTIVILFVISAAFFLLAFYFSHSLCLNWLLKQPTFDQHKPYIPQRKDLWHFL